MPGVTMEPVVEGSFLATEVVEVMLPPQRLGLRIRHDYSKTLGFEKSLRSPLGTRGGRSSSCVNCSQLDSPSGNWVRSARMRRASATAATRMKLLYLVSARSLAARTKASSDSSTRTFQRRSRVSPVLIADIPSEALYMQCAPPLGTTPGRGANFPRAGEN